MASNNKEWRRQHHREWNEQRRRRDARNRSEIGATTRTWRAWSLEEGHRITAEDRPNDAALSAELHRTINAIEKMRHRIRNGAVVWLDGEYRQTPGLD